MAQAAVAINTLEILVDPEYKLMKYYYVRAGKQKAFLDFCQNGLPDGNGGFQMVKGQPAEGVCKWLRDKGVKRADFWISEEKKNSKTQNPIATDSQEEEAVLFVAAVDKCGLKGPDWSAILGIHEYLDFEYSLKEQSALRLSDPDLLAGFLMQAL